MAGLFDSMLENRHGSIAEPNIKQLDRFAGGQSL